MADPVESLGSFPIIQIAVAAVIAMGGMIAVWRGLTAKPRRTAGEGVEWFFDGPVVKALEVLQNILRENAEGRREQREAAEEHNKKLDKQTEILLDIRECVTRERMRPRR